MLSLHYLLHRVAVDCRQVSRIRNYFVANLSRNGKVTRFPRARKPTRRRPGVVFDGQLDDSQLPMLRLELSAAPTTFAAGDPEFPKLLSSLGRRTFPRRMMHVFERSQRGYQFEWDEEFYLTEIATKPKKELGSLLTRKSVIELTTEHSQMLMEIRLFLEDGRFVAKSKKPRYLGTATGHVFDLLTAAEAHLKVVRHSPLVALSEIWITCVKIFVDRFRTERKSFIITGINSKTKRSEVVPDIIWDNDDIVAELPDTITIMSEETPEIKELARIHWSKNEIVFAGDKWRGVVIRYNDKADSVAGPVHTLTQLKQMREDCVFNYAVSLIHRGLLTNRSANDFFNHCEIRVPRLKRSEFDRAWKRAFM